MRYFCDDLLSKHCNCIDKDGSLLQRLTDSLFAAICRWVLASLNTGTWLWSYQSTAFISERSEQDAESETQSIAEENHNADVDEEHDADMDEDVKKEEADSEDGVPAQVTDNKTVVSMPEPVTDGVEVKVKDEARSQAEVRVFALVVAILLYCYDIFSLFMP